MREAETLPRSCRRWRGRPRSASWCATRWTTSPCSNSPAWRMLAPITIRRNFSNVVDHRGSSSAADEQHAHGAAGALTRNTGPAASSHRPSRACMASSQVTIRRACRSARRNATGCRRKVQADVGGNPPPLAPGRHRLERHLGFLDLHQRLVIARCDSREEGEQQFVAQRLDRPERLASGQAQGRLVVGFGELQATQTPARRHRSSTEATNRRRRRSSQRRCSPRTTDHAHAETHREHPSSSGSSSVIPARALTHTGAPRRYAPARRGRSAPARRNPSAAEFNRAAQERRDAGTSPNFLA